MLTMKTFFDGKKIYPILRSRHARTRDVAKEFPYVKDDESFSAAAAATASATATTGVTYWLTLICKTSEI